MSEGSVSSKEEIHHICHISIHLSTVFISLGLYGTCTSLKIRSVPRPYDSGSELLGSRPRVRVGVLVLLVQCILVEAIVQLHLAPMVGCLLVTQMFHVCVHLELHPLYVS